MAEAEATVVEIPNETPPPPAMPAKRKGSPILSVRIPDELLEEMDQAMTGQKVPVSRSEWIIAAIEGALDKRLRSSGKRARDIKKRTYARRGV